MDHQIFANFSITINIEKSLKKWTFTQKLGVCFRKTPKILTVALLKIVVWISAEVKSPVVRRYGVLREYLVNLDDNMNFQLDISYHNT